MKQSKHVALCMALLIAWSAHAVTITPTLQDRAVASSATELVGGTQTAADQDSQVAVGFGLFNAFVNSVVNTDNSASFPTAQQSSQISAASIVAEGDVDANSDNLGNAGVTASSHSESLFKVAFTVDAGLSWRFAGEVKNEDGGSPYVRLSHPTGTLFETTLANQVFDVAVQLLPGTEYTLEATALADALANDSDPFSAQGATFRLSLNPAAGVPDGGAGTVALIIVCFLLLHAIRPVWVRVGP